MNAIGYVRISSKDQSKWSLASQEKYIREYCARNQVNVVEMFIDDGKKSYTFDRPDYIALEKFIKKHKNHVQYLVVLDHDRFSRNLPEALMKIEQLEKKHALKVIATSEPLDIDTGDPMVFMQRAFKYMMANQELFTIRRRARIGIRQAQESGRFVHLAPFGYLNSKEKNGKTLLLIDQSRAFIIKKVFRDFITGIPHFIIYKDIIKLGFTLRGSDAIVRVLTNPLYAGLVRVTANEKNPERFTKGVHEAIVPEYQFWRAQELLIENKRKEKVQPKDDFHLRGVLTCTCGSNLTASYSKGKKNYYMYYRCTRHGCINISGKKVHGQLDEVLSVLSFDQQQIEHISKKVKASLKDAAAVKYKQLEAKHTQLKDVAFKIERIEERLLNDEIETVTYKKYFRKYNYEKALLQEEIKSLGEDNSEKIKKQLNLLAHLVSLPALYEAANLSQKQSLLKGVFQHGLMYKEGAFRTPYINEGFEDKMLILNKKGLLFVEQPSRNLSTIPCGAEEGTRTPTP